MYQIQPRTFKMATKLGVKVRPSEDPKYKIDVLDYHENYITSIGDKKYKDYTMYLQMEKDGEVPKGYADKRREMYWIRHGKEIDKLGKDWEGSRSYYSFLLLW
jgi:hypothetical protein